MRRPYVKPALVKAAFQLQAVTGVNLVVYSNVKPG